MIIVCSVGFYNEESPSQCFVLSVDDHTTVHHNHFLPMHTYMQKVSQPIVVNCSNFAIHRTDDAFERNKKDVFKIKTTDLGLLKKLM